MTLSQTMFSYQTQQSCLPSASPQALPRSCIESAVRSQTRGYFLDSHLPSHARKWPKLETDLSVVPATGWLQVAAALASTDTLLDNTLTLLSLPHLERVEKKVAGYQSPVLCSKAMGQFSTVEELGVCGAFASLVPLLFVPSPWLSSCSPPRVDVGSSWSEPR